MVDLDYVFRGAVCVGLNRWTLPRPTQQPPGAFAPTKPDGAVTYYVHVQARDDERARELAAVCDVPLPLVFSIAVCTGLAMMAGDPAIRGPFEV